MMNDNRPSKDALLNKANYFIDKFGDEAENILFAIENRDGSVAMSHYGTKSDLLNMMTNIVLDERVIGHKLVREWAEILLELSVRH